MKRVCTESEKALLYKNRSQMLEGIYQTASKSKLGQTFISLALSVISMFAGLFLIAYTFDVSKPVLIIWMLVSLFVFNAVFSMILNTLRINREKRAFIKRKNLMINGATLVAIEDNNCFLYIEDDFLDEEGKPILIEYPSRVFEMSQEDVGKRFLVIYDGASNFQLARLNDALKDLIPAYSSFYPLAGEPSEYSRVPHPNVANIDKSGHELSGSEKEKFADLYVEVAQSIGSRARKMGLIIETICFLFICFLLNIMDDGYPLEKTLPICAIAWIAMLIYIFLLSCVGRIKNKRQGRNLVYVKEVVFHSYSIESSHSEVKVYEWDEDRVRVREYPIGKVAPNTVYGSILYKFTNQKGDDILMNTSPLGKRKTL